MRPLSEAARIRVGNEGAVKERVQLAIERMVDEPVAYVRLVDVARLRVGNLEVVIAAVLIDAFRQIMMKHEYIGHQVTPEFLHISPLAFPSCKLPPRVKQILYRNDIVIGKIP